MVARSTMAARIRTFGCRPSWHGETPTRRTAMALEEACAHASGKFARHVRPTGIGGDDCPLRIGGKAVAGFARMEQKQAVLGNHPKMRMAGRRGSAGKPDRVIAAEL